MSFYYNMLRTQWRHGFDGPTGLDYNVLLHELDRRGLEKAAYDELFASIRLIEAEALNVIRKKSP